MVSVLVVPIVGEWGGIHVLSQAAVVLYTSCQSRICRLEVDVLRDSALHKFCCLLNHPVAASLHGLLRGSRMALLSTVVLRVFLKHRKGISHRENA